MVKPSRAHIDRALQFNCPDCDVSVGHFCRSRGGIEMALFVHPGRMAYEASQFEAASIGAWLQRHPGVLTDTA